ncbi:MAG: peptidase domain-containing ABC transporter [Raineya sp.]|jgi:ATP-binding cassette subfamily B protein|nr:peptidase domain-containing ABC transporter [Raineya sp.]
MAKFVFYKQYDRMDCGPTCLRMILKYYGKEKNPQEMRQIISATREGVSLQGLSMASLEFGLRPLPVKDTYESLQTEEGITPFIAHWRQEHYVVVISMKPNKVTIADPEFGIVTYSKSEFITHWSADGKEGLVLLLEPTPEFYQKPANEEEESIENKKEKLSFKYFLSYLIPYRALIMQLIVSLIMLTGFSLVMPFITRSIVDAGISNRDQGFVYLMLISQVFITVFSTLTMMLQKWVTMYLSTRINVSMISDYIIKLTKLPIAYFDSKMTGDIMQRINDYSRIQQLISIETISNVFQFVNLIFMSFILLYYNTYIFLVFAVGSTLYVLWIVLFLKQRAKLDAKSFQHLAGNKNVMIQLIQGMQEIKLNGSEEQKRWEWEYTQARIFRLNLKSEKLKQYQNIGTLFINEGKNIFIAAYSAVNVIEGNFTVGTMFAISAIVGQLNGPIHALMSFITSLQDAKLSKERIAEIYEKNDEEKESDVPLPNKEDIVFKNVCFRYDKTSSKYILKNLNFVIPWGKITAIVGSSGSGKTTLLKLLLKFHESEQEGDIYFGGTPIKQISARSLRKYCSAVMQETFIFSDSIQRNIAMSDEMTDIARFEKAVKTAHVHEFVRDLPNGYSTKIGTDGINLSGGQKQRINIARAVYKNPNYLFLDEATSALDANSEAVITRNLGQFLKGKTAVIIAHRLSTVKNADQIIVLEKGEVVEVGNHKDLVSKQGRYYDLVKNQLELGN